MRELVYYVAVSLDGRIAAPDDTFDDFPQTGDHIDMILREWTDTIPAVGLRMLGLTAPRTRFDTVLMGWNTYAAGLSVTTDPYPHLEQFVLSRSRRADAVPPGITLTGRDPVELVRELRQRPGADIWLCGGGRIAAALSGEIDRMVLNRARGGQAPVRRRRSRSAVAAAGPLDAVPLRRHRRRVHTHPVTARRPPGSPRGPSSVVAGAGFEPATSGL